MPGVRLPGGSADMKIRFSGVLLGGIVALLAIGPPDVFGAQAISKTLAFSSDEIDHTSQTICLPLPECQAFRVEIRTQQRLLRSHLVETAYIRDQRIGIFRIDDQIEPHTRLELSLTYEDPLTPISVDTGPLAGALRRLVVGYDPQGISELASTDGGCVTRCVNLAQCRDAKADILLIVGHCIYTSSYVDSLAMLWAEHMGLNVAIIDVINISAYSAVAIKDFIKRLYSSASAEHHGDGHLGFVVLLGDAYEDDNVTKMVPEYDGYGLNMEASDHFYACLVGEDDFEDIMIGRIPVGNEQELINYYRKLRAYSPLPFDAWTTSLLFVAGCYFAENEDYVVLFDSLEAYVPEEYEISRFYRYDFPLTDQGDAQATQAFIDSVNAGRLFVLYSGDGDKFDWGARHERVFRSARIEDLENSDRLAIVLSISCSSGWFDNTAVAYSDGGYDCLAERLVVEPDDGAIACLASSREAGGGATTVFAPEIIKALFVNGCTFLGELIFEAKTRHLLALGNVEYVRQFNLFGDPCLNFVLHDYPAAAPDITIRPYSVKVDPKFPTPDDNIHLEAEVWNAGGANVGQFRVDIYAGNPDSGGVQVGSEVLTDFWGWEKRKVDFTVGPLAAGDVDLYLVADPGDSIQELDETNNSLQEMVYVYPCQDGFPVKLGDDPAGEVVADLNNDGTSEILVASDGSCAQAIALDGHALWSRDDLGMPHHYKGIEPTAFDLNGDGLTEAILTTRSSLLVLEGANGSTIWRRYTDYPVLSPVVSDLDGDGSYEILLGTYSSYSQLAAFDASGSWRWTYDVPGYGNKLSSIVVCDTDLDGFKEIVFATTSGTLACLTCSEEPPTLQWEKKLVGNISCAVAGDLERDGILKIVAAIDDTVAIFDADDGHRTSSVICPQAPASLSLGDLDGDLDLELVCLSGSGQLYEIDDGVIAYSADLGSSIQGGCAIADVDEDGQAEIMVATKDGRIHLLNPSLGYLISPVPMKALCAADVTAWDIDADSNIEIFAGSSDSLLFVLDLGSQGGRVEWPTTRSSPTRSGTYAQPLYGEITGSLRIGGRIDVVGDVVVGEGATLTFDRSSLIRLVHDSVYPAGISEDRCEIIVEGNLYASGSTASPVVLEPAAKPYARDTWSGVLIKDTGHAGLSRIFIHGAITGVECETDDVVVSECRMSECVVGIKTNDLSPYLDHNTISNCDYGINVNGGAPIIVGNMLTSNKYDGLVVSGGSTAILEDNRFYSTVEGHGLACYSSTPSILPGNRFEHNSLCGIYLSNSSPQIDSCWIGYNGDCGIKAAYYSSPVVSKTSIVSNAIGVGIYVYSNPILGDESSGLGGLNDIRLNAQYAIYNTTSNEIKAQANWWGSSDPDPSMFYGDVDYSDWLDTSPAGIANETHQALLRALYPVPFKERLNILTSGSMRYPIRIDIFDIRGRLVRTILSPAGNADLVIWDGLDNDGNPTASGTYFVSIQNGNQRLTRKVILLR